jgi:hypothetical protein
MTVTVPKAAPPVPLPRYPVPAVSPAWWVRVRTWNDHHAQPS